MKKINISIAYSRKDSNVLEQLRVHLKILERKKFVKLWYDGLIQPGEEWDKKVKLKLETSEIILLLISSDFIASDYCYNIELQKALEKHENNSAFVIPIIVRDCLWEESNFAHLELVPENGLPIISQKWDTSDEPYKLITLKILEKINIIKQKRENRKNDKLYIVHEVNKNTISSIKIIEYVKTIFKTKDERLALVIFHLGHHRFNWRTIDSVILKTKIEEKQLKEIIRKNSKMFWQRTSKATKKDLLCLKDKYKLTFQKHFYSSNYLNNSKINYQLYKICSEIKINFEMNDDSLAILIYNLSNRDYNSRSIVSLTKATGIERNNLKKIIEANIQLFKLSQSKSGKELISLKKDKLKIAKKVIEENGS